MTAFLAVSQSSAAGRVSTAPAVSERQTAVFAEALRQLERNATDMLGMQAVSLTGASVVRETSATEASAALTDAPAPASTRTRLDDIRAGWRDERCRVLAQDTRPPQDAHPTSGAVISTASSPAFEDEPGLLPPDAAHASAPVQHDDHAPKAAAGEQPAASDRHQPGDVINRAPPDLNVPADALAPSPVSAVMAPSPTESAHEGEWTTAIRASTGAAGAPANPSVVQINVSAAMTGAPQVASQFATTMVRGTVSRLTHVAAAAPPVFQAPTSAPITPALVVAHVAADRAALAVRIAGLSEASERELLQRLRAELGAHGLRCYSLQLNGAGAMPASPT